MSRSHSVPLLGANTTTKSWTAPLLPRSRSAANNESMRGSGSIIAVAVPRTLPGSTEACIHVPTYGKVRYLPTVRYRRYRTYGRYLGKMSI